MNQWGPSGHLGSGEGKPVVGPVVLGLCSWELTVWPYIVEGPQGTGKEQAVE